MPADLVLTEPAPLTHAELVRRAVAWLRGGRMRCKVVFAEIATVATVFPDAIGWRWGESHLVECKRTRADFRADRDKVIHRNPDRAPGVHRWYLTPTGLVAPDEVPAGWGLVEVYARSTRVVVQAERHVSAGRLAEDARILVSAVQRHQLGVGWDDKAARFAAYGTLGPQVDMSGLASPRPAPRTETLEADAIGEEESDAH